MAKTKSARKMIQVVKRRQSRNKSVRSRVKTYISKAEKLILSNELEPARDAVVQASSTLDRAAKKGVIHHNNAARRKSRLMKKLNAAQALPTVSPT